MKFLKGLLIVLLVLFAAYTIWMFTLPAKYTMERSIVINAPTSQVYNTVDDLTTWDKWSYWQITDPEISLEYSDPSSGEGAWYKWSSPNKNTGSGQYTNAKNAVDASIDYELQFGEMPSATGFWKFEGGDDGTTVTYGINSEFTFFTRSFKVIFIDGALASAFEQSLDSLKGFVETMPAEEPAPSIEIAMVDVSPMAYYSVTDEIAMDDLTSEFFAERYGELGAFLGQDMAENMTGAPFAIYQKWDEENRMAIVEVAVPCASEKEGGDRVKKNMTHDGKALKSVHMGAYDEAGKVHYGIMEYVKANNIEIIGAPWEVYVTDPSEEPDTSLWITEIYYPVSDGAGSADAGTDEDNTEAEG